MVMGPENHEGYDKGYWWAEILVKGDSQWRLINGTFPVGWPVYAQTGVTMNNKVYFLGRERDQVKVIVIILTFL